MKKIKKINNKTKNKKNIEHVEKKKIKKDIENLSNLEEDVNNNNNGTMENIKYVVTRGGKRVSDKEYSDSNDPECISELEFWTNVAIKHSHGEKVKIEIFDSKLHRIW